MRIHDLIGVGFGPSNIALAIALDERTEAGRPIDAFFLEKQPSFAWHPHMLLSHAHMQIAFLKDLATLRNPRSRFTFVNYLHERQRLPAFINLKTFYPSRREFNDYLAWAAGHFDECCSYGEEVVDVLPEIDGDRVDLLRLRSRDRVGRIRERLTRHLVVSVGGSPRVPEAFTALMEDSRIIHSSAYLQDGAALDRARRVAVIGGGQSAAEIFIDLHNRGIEVDLIMRGQAMRPSDDSPFANEIFDADFTDYLFGKPRECRAGLLAQFQNTNYAAPDLELIQAIYKVFYEQRVHGVERHRHLRRHDVESATIHGGRLLIGLRNLDSDQMTLTPYDLVVLATGYEREAHRDLLGSLEPWLGDWSVDRRYQLITEPEFLPKIFLQGACEGTHGLSDTLLSVIAVRAGEIADRVPCLQDGRRSNAEAFMK